MSGAANWVAVDWGTTRLRAWAMNADGSVLHEASSDKGMGRLNADGFEPALLELISGWLGEGRVPVVACGMVGARQGWTEAAYRTVPGTPLGQPLTHPPTQDPRLDVAIVPGLSQTRPGSDVLRGEETQIAGYLHRSPDFDGVICLPGTHTKWAQISAGEVVSFQTVMTGELFALLSGQSVLRHSVGTTDGAKDDESFAKAFDDGVSACLSRPETLAARLFAIRAEGLLQGLGPMPARGRLSGLLIGAELAATRPYWLGQDVAIIGTSDLSALYARALTAQGAAPQITDAAAMTLNGLRAAYAIWKGQP